MAAHTRYLARCERSANSKSRRNSGTDSGTNEPKTAAQLTPRGGQNRQPIVRQRGHDRERAAQQNVEADENLAPLDFRSLTLIRWAGERAQHDRRVRDDAAAPPSLPLVSVRLGGLPL